MVSVLKRQEGAPALLGQWFCNSKPTPDKEHPINATMQPPRPDQIAFDDPRLGANAGLLLPPTLAQHLGLLQLVQQRLDLGNAPGRANTGDKMMTLVASALAGGDCIDDADALRAGVLFTSLN